ncbi:InlB B-repeat-containing protein [Breznakiellaceae bacterium SP9]
MRILNNYTPTHKAGRMALARPAIGAIALIALLLSGCDNFSPVDYFLDHTAVVTVTGAEGRSASRAKVSGVDIAPGTSVIALKLDNSRNIPLTLNLDAPRLNSGGGAISCTVTQNGAGEALITIHGAVIGDEFTLTLRIEGDGRTFDPYTFSVRCPVYTVTFDNRGFGGTAPIAQTPPFTLFDTVSDPGNLTEAGHTFDGWYKESACVNRWNFATDTVTGDTVIYAKWDTTLCTVTFNMQGHGTPPAPASVYQGGLVTAPTAPSATGWTFGGWYKESACTNVWNFTTEGVSTNTILYAKWTFNSNISTAQGWLDAITAIQNGGNGKSYTLNISGNLNAYGGYGATFGSVTGLNVTLGGTGSLTLTWTGSLINVGPNQTVTINGPILTGNSGNNMPLVSATGANANLVLQNGTISGNVNNFYGGGGGVSISGGGSFTMSGGTISGNSALYGSGGGVYVNYGGTFTMSGGTISSNSANSGGGVFVNSGGTFTLNNPAVAGTGGNITGNMASGTTPNVFSIGTINGTAGATAGW